MEMLYLPKAFHIMKPYEQLKKQANSYVIPLPLLLTIFLLRLPKSFRIKRYSQLLEVKGKISRLRRSSH